MRAALAALLLAIAGLAFGQADANADPDSKVESRLKALAEELGLPLEAVLPFSSTDKIGVEEVWDALLDTFGKRSVHAPEPRES